MYMYVKHLPCDGYVKTSTNSNWSTSTQVSSITISLFPPLCFLLFSQGWFQLFIVFGLVEGSIVFSSCVPCCVLLCHCREELACGTLHVETGDSTAGGGEQPHPERDADSAEIHGRRVPGQRGSPHRQLLCARLERLREISEVGDDAPVIFTGSASTLSLSFFSLSLSHFSFLTISLFPSLPPPLCVLHHYFTFVLYELTKLYFCLVLFSPSPASTKVLCESSVTETLFRFLQLLCEGHNTGNTAHHCLHLT